MIVVALPVIDVSLAMIRRYKKGHGIMEPDKDHLHHRLMSRGWTAREVVLLVYVLTLDSFGVRDFSGDCEGSLSMTAAKKSPIKVMAVFGTRPEAIKMAPVCRVAPQAPERF